MICFLELTNAKHVRQKVECREGYEATRSKAVILASSSAEDLPWNHTSTAMDARSNFLPDLQREMQ